MFEDTNKSIIFEEFLMGLSKVCESEDELSALFNKACELYKDNWRHSYSFVTKTILKQMEKQPLNGVLSLNDTLYTIFDNLKSLNGKICQLLKSHDDNVTDEELHILEKSITKLADHIELEFVRLDYIQKNHQIINDATVEINNKFCQISNELGEINNEFNEIKKKYSSFNLDLEKKEKSLEDIKQDFKHQKIEAITILGIFVGIVAVISVDIGISSSLLANMAKIATPRLFLFLFITAFFNISILGALFLFLLKLNGSKLGIRGILVVVLLCTAPVFLIVLTINYPNLFSDFIIQSTSCVMISSSDI